MLAVTNVSIVLQVFFDNSQHNLTRRWSETVGPVITRAFFLALLENQNNVCLSWLEVDLSGLPRPLKNNWERSHDDNSKFPEHPGMNFIVSHGLACIQMEQQILHKLEVGWELVTTAVMILQLWDARAHCQDWRQAKEAWNICFVCVPLCKMTTLIK